MIEDRHQRVWLWITTIVIIAALVLMLVPQAHSGHAVNWLAILPVLFIGLLAPRTLFAPLAIRDSVRAPNAPALQASFQRPPPFLLA